MTDFRKMDKAAIDGMTTYIAGCLAKYIAKNCPNCPSCKHFDFMNETCKLNKQRPPANVIAFGCEMFEY